MKCTRECLSAIQRMIKIRISIPREIVVYAVVSGSMKSGANAHPIGGAIDHAHFKIHAYTKCMQVLVHLKRIEVLVNCGIELPTLGVFFIKKERDANMR